MTARIAILPLLALLCISTMSFKGMNKRVSSTKNFCYAKEMSQKRFCYLRATRQNITGDTYVYSEVIEFDARQWNTKQVEILMEFEEKLSEMYAESTFEVTLDCAEGVYRTKEEAIRNKNKAIEKLNDSKQRIENLKSGLPVRF